MDWLNIMKVCGLAHITQCVTNCIESYYNDPRSAIIEIGRCMDFQTGDLVFGEVEGEKGSVYFKDHRKQMIANNGAYVHFHNHPDDSLPSLSDFYNFINTPELMVMIVVGRNESVDFIHKPFAYEKPQVLNAKEFGDLYDQTILNNRPIHKMNTVKLANDHNWVRIVCEDIAKKVGVNFIRWVRP